jgi:hypothetical protein
VDLKCNEYYENDHGKGRRHDRAERLVEDDEISAYKSLQSFLSKELRRAKRIETLICENNASYNKLEMC